MGFFYVKKFTIFVGIVALIATISAFLLYRKSNYNKMLLLPIIAWLTVTYLLIVTVDQYLAVAVLLFVAYIERKNLVLSAVCIGLAASTIQLAWFALPFMLVLIWKEYGKERMIKTIVIALIAFLVVNGYFILIGPKQFISNVFGLFGPSKILLSGTDLMQIFVRSYGVTLWAVAAISLMILLSSIILYYLYPSTLKPFLAIVPAFIFMLSWRNLLLYSLPFVPILIYMCYEKDAKPVKDMIKNRSYIVMTFAALIILSLVIAVYAHGVYLKQNYLVINFSPVIQKTANQTNFTNLTVSVTNR